jgi:hypothetical protein
MTIIGLSAFVGIEDARSAPPIDPINAGSAMAINNFQLKVIARLYKSVAAEVPNTEVSLFVPNTSTVSNLGSPIRSAGS